MDRAYLVRARDHSLTAVDVDEPVVLNLAAHRGHLRFRRGRHLSVRSKLGYFWLFFGWFDVILILHRWIFLFSFLEKKRVRDCPNRAALSGDDGSVTSGEMSSLLRRTPRDGRATAGSSQPALNRRSALDLSATPVTACISWSPVQIVCVTFEPSLVTPAALQQVRTHATGWFRPGNRERYAI